MKMSFCCGNSNKNYFLLKNEEYFGRYSVSDIEVCHFYHKVYIEDVKEEEDGIIFEEYDGNFFPKKMKIPKNIRKWKSLNNLYDDNINISDSFLSVQSL